MTKEEIRNYAISQYESEITKIEEAYNKGFEDGKAEALKNAPSEPTEIINGVKYYDLGLPSGTLWSEPVRQDSFFMMLPHWCLSGYHSHLMHPTNEQIKEINETCEFTENFIIGPNGCKYPKIALRYFWMGTTPYSGNLLDYQSFYWGRNIINTTNVFKDELCGAIVVRHR